MPHQTLRIIDANCNRIGEGLRFLEDVARFLVNDVDLTRQLKTIRHKLVKGLGKFSVSLLSERNPKLDVGLSIEPPDQKQDLLSLIMANARRVEEALRVVEELAKSSGLGIELNSKEFAQARFDLYSLERELSSKVLRQQKIARLRGLYVIIDTEKLGQKDEVDATSQAIRGGASVIQLRDKGYDKSKLFTLAQKMKDVCHSSGSLFIVNDHLDIALAVNADGLHIGQEDLPLSVVRGLLPIDKIIGLSTHSLAEAQKAEAEGADYIAFGSIFPSQTKKDAKVVGLEYLRQVRQKISIPIVAIGGIDKENIIEVIAAGADGAAVISAVVTKDNIEVATRQLVNAIEEETKSHKKPGIHR